MRAFFVPSPGPAFLPLAALVACAAASPAAGQTSPSAVPLPLFALPAFSGAGFGTALSTPATRAALGNPGALPAHGALGVAVRSGTAASGREAVQTNLDGSTTVERDRIVPAAAPLPHEAGAVWAVGPLRLAAGYARPLDGEWTLRVAHFDHAGGTVFTTASRWETAGAAMAYPMFVTPGLRFSPGVRVAASWWRNRTRYETDGPLSPTTTPVGRSSYAETVEASAVTWAVGALVDGAALPVRLGVAFADGATGDGTETVRCAPVADALCGGTSFSRKATGRIPARLEGSVGGEAGPWAAEATLARVFWRRGQGPDDAVYRDATEGSVNLRYAPRPGVTLTLGLNQTARAVFEGGEGDDAPDLFEQDPTRFVLVGATLQRGPVVLDAAYVNGTLLSARGSRHHLGSVGAGYRF